MSYGKNLLSNASFETLISGTPDDGVTDDFLDWAESASGGLAEQTNIAYDGKACKLTYSTSYVYVLQSLLLTFLTGEKYKIEIYGRGDGGSNSSTVRLRNNTTAVNEFQEDTGLTGTAYQKWSAVHTMLADSSSLGVYFFQLVGAGTSYFDKSSLRKQLTRLYIDPTGDDANQGDTNLVPIKTLAEMEDRGFYNGSAFTIAAGTYNESITIGDDCFIDVPSGTATVDEIDFASKTVTITGDLVVLNAINAENVTGGTLLTAERGFSKFKHFNRF